MKAVLCFVVVGVILVLGTMTLSVGQNPPQPMFSGVQADDRDCNSALALCDLAHFDDCVRFPFVGSFDGPAHLEARIICLLDHPHCGGCFVCAYVFREPGDIIQAHTETPQDCSGDCVGQNVSFTMTDNANYQLIVCKRSCDGHCDDCSSYCYAHAAVYPN